MFPTYFWNWSKETPVIVSSATHGCSGCPSDAAFISRQNCSDAASCPLKRCLMPSGSYEVRVVTDTEEASSATRRLMSSCERTSPRSAMARPPFELMEDVQVTRILQPGQLVARVVLTVDHAFEGETFTGLSVFRCIHDSSFLPMIGSRAAQGLSSIGSPRYRRTRPACTAVSRTARTRLSLEPRPDS